MNEFLLVYVEQIRDQCRQYDEWVAEADRKGKFSLAQQYQLKSETWWMALMLYYKTVLNRRRFRAQASMAAAILRELNPDAWEIWSRPVRKRKSSEQPPGEER